MQEKRVLKRFATQLKARYSLQERIREWEECTITNITPKGMGITFHTHAKIDAGLIINLEIDIRTYINNFLKQGVSKEKISLESEKMIRAYDPCLSCATHFLKINLL